MQILGENVAANVPPGLREKRSARQGHHGHHGQERRLQHDLLRLLPLRQGIRPRLGGSMVRVKI